MGYLILAQAQPESAPLWTSFVPLIIVVVIFWFLIIRPQSKQRKEHQSMLDAVKKNDHVLTSGGIYGIVDRIKDNDVYLKIDEKTDVKIRVTRNAIVSVEKQSSNETAPEQTQSK